MTKNISRSESQASELNEPFASAQPTKPSPPGFAKLIIDLTLSIAIPVYILRKFSAEESLGPTNALLVALMFPLLAGIYEFIKDRKIGLMPSIGFISILLTGGIGVLKLPKEYIAIKEALVPLGFGVAVLASTFTKKPLIRTFIYNDLFMETDKVANRVKERNKNKEFDALMVTATWILASSFLMSSVLNYILAKIIIVSDTGTEAFNQEFSTMTMLSYPVIALPSTLVTMYAMYFVFTRILRMTDFKIEDILRQ